MTKDEEIAILDATILKLGTNSYIGPWLMSMRTGIEREIRDDHEPVYTLAWYQDHCKSMVSSATEFSNDIREKAQAQADKIIKDAEKKVAEKKYYAAHHLRKALEEVE
jgi:hypothetical protein